MSDKNFISLLVVTVCFFFSCNKDIVFCDFQAVPDKVWDRETGFLFHFKLNDVSFPYDVSLQLRNNTFYPYQNLRVIFDAQHAADTIVKDTVVYMLADSSGQWTGNGITLFQNQFPLLTNYHFSDTGQYIISIHHSMLEDRLKGIENIGLVIERTR